MINRNSVHLPDTTYGGNPIDWNCSSDSDDSLQRLKAENAKLRELVADMYAVISRNNSWWDFTHEDTRRFAYRMRELGLELRDA